MLLDVPGMPRSHPEMNAAAVAKTWLGERARSNAFAIEVPPASMLWIVACLASTVAIEAASTNS